MFVGFRGATGATVLLTLVDPEVDLAPQTPLGPAMLSCMPLAFSFALGLGAGAVGSESAAGLASRDRGCR